MSVVTPPPQLNVAPAVVDEAVSVSEVEEQVSVVGAVIEALGEVMFWVTVVPAPAVQPLDGSVTVTVREAGAVTVIAAEVIPPPQL